jgi:hypothetical protein
MAWPDGSGRRRRKRGTGIAEHQPEIGGLGRAGMTNDTPAADKFVILELVTNIRTADGFEFLPGIAVTYAVRDPRFMREDDDGGALRPAVSCHGRGYRTDRNNEWSPAIPAHWHVLPLS